MPSRIEIIIGSLTTLFGLFCTWHTVLDPLPHPTWALAAAVSFVATTVALKR